MKQSKYLRAFQIAMAECAGSFRLIGDAIMVEEIPDEELKTQSGLILASGDKRQLDGLLDRKPTFARALATGPGFYDDDGKHVPLEVKPGDILLVGKLSVDWISAFGPIVTYEKDAKLGITSESQYKAQWDGQEGYDKFFEVLKRELGGKSE